MFVNEAPGNMNVITYSALYVSDKQRSAEQRLRNVNKATVGVTRCQIAAAPPSAALDYHKHKKRRVAHTERATKEEGGGNKFDRRVVKEGDAVSTTSPRQLQRRALRHPCDTSSHTVL